ncbi:3-hydroxyacyl-CoA dehydrogenase NAD-binding domain-containing protein [Limobrevibacterium gyesilva]|uniref:3-hydroxyacyl-CoA dehydrogenase NAD-binding domain-containing protein n=1 Tax=Limobrevibacterium gyesilva TaxID=2991712 RepID=A0AA41YV20_9PROT|nr:3-hydroxyacyl-CoA dehydrogenase NAD-binding domain-containing protein [Limobrevibacterium gyesilva]MCW3475932.1 3-hydroxyacyl-CoA dehydrogenase NAD-binding domain-containing protein [Limobrevibacterium gyesilva]
MKSQVQVVRHADVAMIEIDNPPVNALSNGLRQEILKAVQGVMKDPAVRAAVLACAGKTFVAGADIREFDGPPGEVTTGDICRALDDAPKPVVAALHGTALGGGFELALGCHARIMAPDARVGLPESRIGLIPGAGGTQRAPRLAGAMAALDMVTTGRHVPAHEAMKLGLADEIATDLRKEAILRARALADAGHWPRVRDLAVPPCDRAAFDAVVAQVRKRARGALAPVAAAEAIGWALDLPFDEAVARERAASLALRGGPQSKALRHLFHAERVAARMPGTNGHVPAPWPVKHAGVVGGGTMGSGIAITFADAGLEVTLVEMSDEMVKSAKSRIRAVYDRHVKSGRIPAAVRDERMDRITFSTHLSRLSDCDLVVEAVIEDLPTKQDVFRHLSAIVRRDCILASNTSRLDVNRIAGVVDAPERVLGLHFFSPAHVMRLLEIVRADRTLAEVLSTALALARRIGKQAVIAGVCDGFIGNRILSRWRQQADYMLEDGAYPQDVDAALEAYGFAMGPYAVADLAGLDIGWAGRKRAAATRDPRARYVPIADWLCELGRFGQKTGAGYYLHKDGKRQVDPLVNELVERASAARQITRRKVPAAEIQSRVHAAMVNEAARVLAEGIAQRPSDIDVVLVNGYGYPAWRGGPMHEADRIGLPVVLERVARMYEADGPGWEPAPLLQEMVAAGKRFADLNG